MAFQLYIINDSGNTVYDLTAYVLEYTPRAAPVGTETIRETVRLRLPGGRAAAQTILQAIDRIAADARRWTDIRVPPRYFLALDYGSSDSPHRSLLYDMTPIPDGSLLDQWQLGNGVFVISMDIVRANWWERIALYDAAAYGQSSAYVGGRVMIQNYHSVGAFTAVEVADGNTGGSGDFTGVAICDSTCVLEYTYNAVAYSISISSTGLFTGTNIAAALFRYDITTGKMEWSVTFSAAVTGKAYIRYYPGTTNVIQAPVAEAIGDTPAPIVLQLQNSSSGEVTQQIFVGHVVDPDADLPIQIEAESFVVADTGATSVAEASASGGFRADFILTNTTEAPMYSWQVSAAQIQALAGRTYVPMLRWSTVANTANIPVILYRWRIMDDTFVYTYWQGDQIQLDTSTSYNVRQVGNIQLPAWNLPISATYGEPLKLVLTGQISSGAPLTCSLDFVQLFPAENFYRMTGVGVGGGAALNQTFTTDGSTDFDFVFNGAVEDGANYPYATVNTRATILSEYNRPMMHPGKANKFYILANDVTANSTKIDHIHQFLLSYRPRRRVL